MTAILFLYAESSSAAAPCMMIWTHLLPLHAQVEAFLQRLKRQEVSAVEELELDESELWKRKQPASFKAGTQTPRQKTTATQAAHADWEDDEDMLGPARCELLSATPAGKNSSFAGYRYSGASSGSGARSQQLPGSGEQGEHPALARGTASGGSSDWRKSSWRA